MPIFSVSRVVDCTVGFVARSWVVAFRSVVELLVLPVQLFSRAVVFYVSRSSLLRSLLFNASPVLSCGCFSPFCLQRSVAMLASNLAFERDAAKARRPSTLR